ncbi:hypothetical protein Unana1_06156 [Umbelopsis nana]
MSDPSQWYLLGVLNAFMIIDLNACCILSAVLPARHCPNVKPHYYVLELAALFGVIEYAIQIQSAKTELSDATHLAVYVMSNVTLFFFAAVGTIWVVVVIVITGLSRGSNINATVISPEALGAIVIWGNTALAIWSLIAIVVIRLTPSFGAKVPFGVARRSMASVFSFLSLFILLVYIFTFWNTVTAYVPFPYSALGTVNIINIILLFLFMRFPVLLFMAFHNKLLVMSHYLGRAVAEQEDDEVARPMYT